MNGKFLVIQKPSSGDWACSPTVSTLGNQTLDQLRHRLDDEACFLSDQSASFFNWKSEGKRYDLDNTLLEECDRWVLSHYEVFSSTDESSYAAVVVVYYDPMVKVAIAA